MQFLLPEFGSSQVQHFSSDASALLCMAAMTFKKALDDASARMRTVAAAVRADGSILRDDESTPKSAELEIWKLETWKLKTWKLKTWNKRSSARA
jgi:hypothetical protein